MLKPLPVDNFYATLIKMPIKQSAKKALKQSIKHKKRNLWYKERLKKTWKTGDLTQIYKTIDKAAKKGIIKENKAARKKSQAAKLYSSLTKDQASKDQKK